MISSCRLMPRSCPIFPPLQIRGLLQNSADVELGVLSESEAMAMLLCYAGIGNDTASRDGGSDQGIELVIMPDIGQTVVAPAIIHCSMGGRASRYASQRGFTLYSRLID